MNKHPYVVRQVFQLLPRYVFDRIVEQYHGDYHYRHFTSYSHLLHLLFGQIVGCGSIRDICLCLNAHSCSLYHLGIRRAATPATLSRAGESRDYRIFEALGKALIEIVRPLYQNCCPPHDCPCDTEIFAIDSSSISCSLKLMSWAMGKYSRGAVKMHTMLNLRGSIPEFIDMTHGVSHDSNFLDSILPQQNAFYVMDKAYVDLAALWRFTLCGAYWITRPKENMRYKEEQTCHVDQTASILYDRIISFTGSKSRQLYPQCFRMVKYLDKDKNETITFITNCMDISALDVANLYRNRWQIEVFFKWIKQNLTIKALWGCSENAVKIHLWCAIIAYLLIAKAKAIHASPYSITECATLIRVFAFERMDLSALLTNTEHKTLFQYQNVKELKLFNC